MLNLVQRKGLVRVVLDEVEDGGGEEFGDETDVVFVVERFDEMNAFTGKFMQGESRTARSHGASWSGRLTIGLPGPCS